MHGNVTELCWDWYESAFRSGAKLDPEGAYSGSSRSVRCGWFYGSSEYSRSARRDGAYPYNRLFMGFRLVRPKIKRAALGRLF